MVDEPIHTGLFKIYSMYIPIWCLGTVCCNILMQARAEEVCVQLTNEYEEKIKVVKNT